MEILVYYTCSKKLFHNTHTHTHTHNFFPSLQFIYLLYLFVCRHFKRYINIIVEFIPQILFLMCIFGWLVFMIFYKWCSVFANPNTVRNRGCKTIEPPPIIKDWDVSRFIVFECVALLLLLCISRLLTC